MLVLLLICLVLVVTISAACGYYLAAWNLARDRQRLQIDQDALALERKLFYRICDVYAGTSAALDHEARRVGSAPTNGILMRETGQPRSAWPAEAVAAGRCRTDSPLFTLAEVDTAADVELWPRMSGTLAEEREDHGTVEAPTASSGRSPDPVSATELLRRCHERRAQRGCPGQRRRGLTTDCVFVGEVALNSSDALRQAGGNQ